MTEDDGNWHSSNLSGDTSWLTDIITALVQVNNHLVDMAEREQNDTSVEAKPYKDLPDPTCRACGEPMQHVRPGKWQLMCECDDEYNEDLTDSEEVP